jgi:hypothetical protein
LERYLTEIRLKEGYRRQATLVLQIEEFRQFAASRTPQPDEPMPLSTDAAWDKEAFGDWQALAYGTTLLGILVSPDTIFVLQQGDGAVVEVRGGSAQYLVSPPADAVANTTPSLCNDDAVHEVVATTHPVSTASPLEGKRSAVSVWLVTVVRVEVGRDYRDWRGGG